MLLLLPAILNGPPPPLAQLALRYDTALLTHPVVTRTATGAALAAAGDAMAQLREQRRERRPALGRFDGVVKPTALVTRRRYDVRRAAALVLVEGFYRGMLQQVIIAWIVSAFSGDMLRRIGLGRLFGAELCALLERVSFNQFVIAPNVYYSMFFITTGAFQGLSWGQIVKRWRTQLPKLVGLNSLYWFPVQVCTYSTPPGRSPARHRPTPGRSPARHRPTLNGPLLCPRAAQLVQFAVVPMEYKVPFICTAGLVWNVILSMLAGSASAAPEGPRHRQPSATEHELRVGSDSDELKAR